MIYNKMICNKHYNIILKIRIVNFDLMLTLKYYFKDYKPFIMSIMC